LKHGASDYVGGSMGYGCSGILTMIIFISTFYLFMKDFDDTNMVKSIYKNIRIFLLWTPVFINETKISIIYVLLFFLLLLRLNVRSLLTNILILSLGAMLLYMFLYTNRQSLDKHIGSADSYYIYEFSMELEDSFVDNDYLEDVLFDIPRGQKTLIGLAELSLNGWDLAFGKGIGAFKGENGNSKLRNEYVNEHQLLFFGSVPFDLYLFMQLGFVGMCFYYFFYLSQFRFIKMSANRRRISLILLATFVMIQFYNTALSVHIFVCIFNVLLLLSNHTISRDTTLSDE
jgi:hypothetical protein